MTDNRKTNHTLEKLINMPLGFKITNLSEDYQEIDAEDKNGNAPSLTGLLEGEEYLISAIHIYGEDEKGNETYDLRIIGIDENTCKTPFKITEIRYELFGEKGTFSYKNFSEFNIKDTFYRDENLYETPTAYETLLESIPKKGLKYLSTNKLINYFEKRIDEILNPEKYDYASDLEEEIEEKLSEEELIKKEFKEKLRNTNHKLIREIEIEWEKLYEESERIQEEGFKYNPVDYKSIKKDLENKKYYEEEFEKGFEKEDPIDELIKQKNQEEEFKEEFEKEFEKETKHLIEENNKTITLLKYLQNNFQANTYKKIIEKISSGVIEEKITKYFIEEGYFNFPDFIEAVKIGYPEYLNYEFKI